MNIDEEKSRIRKEIKRRRLGLSSDVLKNIDMILPEFILAIDDEELQSKLKKAKRSALYRDVNGEVPMSGLAKAFMAKGIKCCFPRVEGDRMVFCDCVDLDKDFEEASFGIKEPVSSKTAVDPKDIDVVVLPAVAYNEEGTRLGMGGGFYDRFLDEHPQCKTIAVCYDLQVVDELPVEEHDRKPDYVVCETSVFK